MVDLSLPAAEQMTGNCPQNALPDQRLKRFVDLSFRGSADGAYRVSAKRSTEYGQAFDKVSLRRWQSVQPRGYQGDKRGGNFKVSVGAEQSMPAASDDDMTTIDQRPH